MRRKMEESVSSYLVPSPYALAFPSVAVVGVVIVINIVIEISVARTEVEGEQRTREGGGEFERRQKEGGVTERNWRRRQRRRRNLLSSCPQPFSIQIEAAKKAQGTHTVRGPNAKAGPSFVRYTGSGTTLLPSVRLLLVLVYVARGLILSDRKYHRHRRS